MQADYKRILIVQTAFIGDVILITPLIRATKQLFPNSTIDVLTIPQTKDVLKNNPYIHKILTFNKREHKVNSFVSIIKSLKSKQYDLAITPHSSQTTAFILYMANIPVRLGFDRFTSRFLLNVKKPHLNDMLKIDKNLHLLTAFTDEKFSHQTDLFPSQKDILLVNEILPEFESIPAIAIAPGSVWATKRWPEEYFKLLTEKLLALDIQIVLLGSKDELATCQMIYEYCKNKNPKAKIHNVAGQLPILASAEVIRHCNLALCNDSGILHIANAVKTDVFAIFGPTTKKFGYYPFRENDKVIETPLPCRPCGSHGGNLCPLKHHRCMRDIIPDKVFKLIKEYFLL